MWGLCFFFILAEQGNLKMSDQGIHLCGDVGWSLCQAHHFIEQLVIYKPESIYFSLGIADQIKGEKCAGPRRKHSLRDTHNSPAARQWDIPYGSPRPSPLHSVWGTRLVPSGKFQAARPRSPQGRLYFPIPDRHCRSLGVCGNWSLTGTLKTLFAGPPWPQPGLSHPPVFFSARAAAYQYMEFLCVSAEGFGFGSLISTAIICAHYEQNQKGCKKVQSTVRMQSWKRSWLSTHSGETSVNIGRLGSLGLHVPYE